MLKGWRSSGAGASSTTSDCFTYSRRNDEPFKAILFSKRLVVGVGTLKLIHSDVASVLEHWVNCGERFRLFAMIVEEWAGKRIFVAPRDNTVDGSPTGAGRRTNRLTMEKMVPLAPISRLTSSP